MPKQKRSTSSKGRRARNIHVCGSRGTTFIRRRLTANGLVVRTGKKGGGKLAPLLTT